MFAPNVRFEGFTAKDWLQLGALFQASAGSNSDGQKRVSGGVVAVTQGSRVIKLLHTERGRLPLVGSVWRGDLEGLATLHHAKWVLALHGGVLSELADRWANALKREHYLLDQVLLLVSVLKELEAEGALELWPKRVAEWPVPTASVVQKGMNALASPGKVVAVGVFDDGELQTCIALRRGTAGFDWVVGPDELRQQMGLLSGDFRRDYLHLVGAIENKLGPLGVGCFGEARTLRALIHHPAPGAWATAVAARDIIVSPLAPAIALPLGLDVGRAAISFVRVLASQLEKRDWFGMHSQLTPTLHSVSDFASSQLGLSSLFGFDPIAFLRALINPHSPHSPTDGTSTAAETSRET